MLSGAAGRQVYQELTYQARRLDHHACIAIWGGNNEIEVAFGWFPESRDPDKARLYAADYTQARARLPRDTPYPKHTPYPTLHLPACTQLSRRPSCSADCCPAAARAGVANTGAAAQSIAVQRLPLTARAGVASPGASSGLHKARVRPRSCSSTRCARRS